MYSLAAKGQSSDMAVSQVNIAPETVEEWEETPGSFLLRASIP